MCTTTGKWYVCKSNYMVTNIVNEFLQMRHMSYNLARRNGIIKNCLAENGKHAREVQLYTDVVAGY